MNQMTQLFDFLVVPIESGFQYLCFRISVLMSFLNVVSSSFFYDKLNSDLGLSVLKMTSESLPTRLDSVATSF